MKGFWAALGVIVAGGIAARVAAQTESRAALAPIAVESAKRIEPTVHVSVSYDKRANLYTYRYVVASGARSRQQIVDFIVPLRGSTIRDLRSPRGWSAMTGGFGFEGGAVGWCACEAEGIVVPAGAENSVREVPSIYQIKPGRSLAGFSFRSPDPPSATPYYAGGFTQIPIEGLDFPAGQEPDRPGFPDDHFKGRTRGPGPVAKPH